MIDSNNNNNNNNGNPIAERGSSGGEQQNNRLLSPAVIAGLLLGILSGAALNNWTNGGSSSPISSNSSALAADINDSNNNRSESFVLTAGGSKEDPAKSEPMSDDRQQRLQSASMTLVKKRGGGFKRQLQMFHQNPANENGWRPYFPRHAAAGLDMYQTAPPSSGEVTVDGAIGEESDQRSSKISTIDESPASAASNRSPPSSSSMSATSLSPSSAGASKKSGGATTTAGERLAENVRRTLQSGGRRIASIEQEEEEKEGNHRGRGGSKAISDGNDDGDDVNRVTPRPKRNSKVSDGGGENQQQQKKNKKTNGGRGDRRSHTSTAPTCGGPLPLDERWTCRDSPGQCAIMFQSMVMRKEHMKILTTEKYADEPLVSTMHAALNIRKHYPELPIILATNYPIGFLENLLTELPHRGVSERFYTDHLTEQHLNQTKSWKTFFDEILYPPGHTEDFTKNTFWFLLKPDGFHFPGMEKYGRILFLDGDTVLNHRELPLVTPGRYMGGVDDAKWNAGRCFRNFRGVKINSKREQAKALREREVLAAEGKPVLGQRPPLSRRSVDGNHQYADLYDIFDTLNVYDLALVPELGSFHDLSNFMYYKFFFFDHECETPYEGIRHGKKGIYGCRYAFRHRYETNFNTGVLAFRANKCSMKVFMERWSIQHRRTPCAKDNTAWDQCSFPQALRKSSLRVGILPEPFDFREALGRGCSPFLYPKPRGQTFPHTPLWPKVPVMLDHKAKVKIFNKLIFKYNIPGDHFVCPPYKADSPISNSSLLSTSNCSEAGDLTQRLMTNGQERFLPMKGGLMKCKSDKSKMSHWADYMPCEWKYVNESFCDIPYDERMGKVQLHYRPWECLNWN